MLSIIPWGTFAWVWLIVEWAIRILALFVVPRNRKPSSATAWLLLIFLFPEIGLLIYLFIGNPKLPKGRRAAQKTFDGFIGNTLSQFRRDRDSNNLLNAQVPEKYQPLARLSESLSHLPVFAGNDVEVLPEYDDAIERIVKDIKKAEHYIHLEYFILALDEITEPLFVALAQAVNRGVVVRVMYDALITRRYPRFKEMKQRLAEDGVLVQPMLPFKLPGKGYVRPDLRNHRKLVVIDGHTGYTGSQNLIRRDYHRKDDIYYDEMVVRLKGPVVLQLAAVFLTDWYSETGVLLDYHDTGVVPDTIEGYGDSLAQVLPSGPGYEDENNLKLFTGLIHSAHKRITIVNPYFVPDESLITAITSAAQRGVDVVMINSEVMDQKMVGHAQRSFYEVLLEAGVKIYWYKAPILLHSKFITVDEGIAVIGSSNLDIRSFELDLEITLISYDADVVKRLRSIESTYLAKSKQIKLSVWKQRPQSAVLMDNLARLTSSLQ